MAYFYACVNIAGINALVLFHDKFPATAKHSNRRRLFLENLGLQLIRPWLQKRIEVLGLPRTTIAALKACGYSKPATTKAERPTKKRKRCYICPSALDRKCSDYCEKCKPCYVTHRNVVVTCDYCVE